MGRIGQRPSSCTATGAGLAWHGGSVYPSHTSHTSHASHSSHSPCLPPCALLLAGLLALAAGTVSATEVTLRLVRAEAPDQLVSTAATTINLAAEKAKADADAEAARIRAARAGKELVLEDKPAKPQAEFDRYVNYMRGIVVDGKIPFQRSYKGSYLGRADVIRLDLADGEHTLDPGGHRFRVAQGAVTSNDPSLHANGAGLDILLQPVTIIAVDGGAIRAMPAEVLRLPVAPRLNWGDESLLPKEEGLAENATFKRLTLYMLPNRGPVPYTVQPSGRPFHVTETGIVVLDRDGQPARDRGVYVENRFTLVLPKVPVPVRLTGRGVQVLISGAAGRFELAARADGELVSTGTFYAYGAPEGAAIMAGTKALGQPLPFAGDLGAFPRRKIVIDATAAGTREPRLLLAALPGYRATAGATWRVRLQFRDALDAATLAPAEVAAFLWRRPVLEADGWLQPEPALGSAAPVAGWRALRLRATDQPELFDVVLPENVPGSVYWVRFVVDRRGHTSPRSALQADFLQAIVNPAAPATVSVFAPVGRHGFIHGARLPFSVVVKTPAALPAATLRVELRRGEETYRLVEQPVAALAPGQHPFHFVLGGDATAALAPGDYQLHATVAGVVAPPWSVRISAPRYREDFQQLSQSFGAPTDIDKGSPYLNIPDDIADANLRRRMFRRTASVLSALDTLNLTDWSTHGVFARYQGRDSSSEVAQVEAMLRADLSLPAHEVYYYQNNFEAALEWLAWQGLGEFNNSLDPFAPRSVVHSVPTEIQARQRHFQIIAQTAQKFDNFVGLTLVKDDTTPIGDTEVGDSGRSLRLQNQLAAFRQKYGAEPPPMGLVKGFLDQYQAGRSDPVSAETARLWEAWVDTQSHILSDYYAGGRAAVEPIMPGLFYGTLGPGWGGTLSGGYPAIAHKYQSPLTIQAGAGDYGHQLILDPFLRTRFFQMSGAECWGVLACWGAGGFYNQKNHFGGFLAGGAAGFGYYSGWKREITAPNVPGNTVWQEERRDLHDIMETYGAMFRQVRPAADVAVFYPYRQSMYDHLNYGVARHHDGYTRFSCYSAMAQLAFHGYNSELVTEEMLDAGALRRFRAVILPGLYYALPQHVKALEEFAAAGGTVLAGSTTTLLPKGAKRIDDDFMECVEADGIWSFNKLLDVGHAWLFAEIRRKAPVLRRALEPVVKPFAQAASDRVLVQTSRAGDGRCTFVWNNSYPSWMGTARVNPGNAEWSGLGEANEGTLMPLREPVSFPADACVYELFTQQRVTTVNPATGRLEAEADLAFTPFRVFVTLPKPVAKLRIETPAEVTLGSHFAVVVTPLDAAGQPLAASLPVRLRLLDPSGAEVWRQAGASFPSFHGELSAPLGRAAGTWTVRVDELVTGRSADVTVAVKAPAGLPFAQSLVAVPTADVQRENLVREFIEARRKDGDVVLVLLDEAQSETRADVAKETVQALAALGIKAEVRRTDGPGVFAAGERVHLYQNWQDMKPAQYIAHHVVLLGGEGESVLTEELQENQLLVRPLTASYPGPGRGAVVLIRSPFAFGRDVLGLFGPDTAGIRAAIARLATFGPAAAGQAVAPPATAPLQAHVLEGTVRAGTPFAAMDGAPAQAISVSRDGSRVAFSVLGYARNLFVFDTAGKLLAEDQVGHINTLALTLLPDGRAVVGSEGASYLRAADGKLVWRVFDGGAKLVVDPAGRYVVRRGGNGFTVLDLALKPLWQFDEWAQCATTKDILFARQATFVALTDRGNTLVYRVTGKAPGITGTYGDEVIFADALTGKVQRRVAVDAAAIRAVCGASEKALLEDLTVYQDGAWATVRVAAARTERLVRLDRGLRPTAWDRFDTPLYIGGTTYRTAQHVLADGRLLFTVGDTLCVSNPDWTELTTVPTEHLLLTMAVAEAAGRVAVPNFAGHVRIFDLALKPVWDADVGSAAQLAWLPDGSLAAGTLRGQALRFDATGKKLWEASLNRFAPPEAVEARWAAIEATPGLSSEADSPWWERLTRSVELGADIAQLSGRVTAAEPLLASPPGEAFGTYLVEWRHGPATGRVSLGLEIVEQEKGGAAGAAPVMTRRVTLAATPGAQPQSEHALLRLGDRPDLVRVTVRGAGEGSAASAVSIRPLAFPSKDLIRIPSLYRDRITETERTSPPVLVDMFMNVAEEGGPHITRWADPLCFVNGRMFEDEPRLLGGRWFGSGNFFLADNFSEVPCWIELKLPRKRVISHIVVAEDPGQARTAVLSVDAYIESHDLRSDLSAFEKRQVTRGFWYNVVKRRGNTDVYNVYRLEKPVFTNQLRVYVLGGYSALSEIELYGALAKETTKPGGAP